MTAPLRRMVKKLACPFCGAVVITNDAEKKISHQAPECARFALFVAYAGNSYRFEEKLDVETGKRAPPLRPGPRRGRR